VRRATRSWPLVWAYRPLLDWALAHRVLTLGLALLVLAGALALTPRIGKEFMPPLNEGDLMFMPITDPATDPAPINMTETVVHLKPESQWRAGMTRERIIGELDAAATMPGVSNIWTQPIINRINMLTTARVPASTAHRRVQLHGDDEAGTHHFPFGPRGSTVSVTG